MWAFTKEGFVSVVAHSEKPDTLLVRARDEDSLLSLVEATGATLRHTPSNDYPYRIEVLRTAYSAWLGDQVSNLWVTSVPPGFASSTDRSTRACRGGPLTG